MTRRTHACLGCGHGDPNDSNPFRRPRRTRHKDQVCAICRRRGVHVRDGQLVVPIVINFGGRRA